MDFSSVMEVVGALGGVGVIAAGIGGVAGKIMSSRAIEHHKASLKEQLETHKSALNKDLETHKLTLGRELETHKSELILGADRNRLILKRQELMFEREHAAAVDFLKIFYGVMPDAWAPDLDWSDAQREIAENLPEHERQLKKFLLNHATALSQEVRKLVASARSKASDGSFEVAQETSEGSYEPDQYPSNTVNKIVDEFYEALSDAEKKIREDLQNGSFSG
ncbi:hypothetical protein HH800_15675 [Sphingobium yanoikuyae]|uniref:Uncharacterized protein n=1 Tax=Sphingobium yanoikuyae TaxID=13690 RepID=A0A6M4G970_SPHYA|nr:hypothetical protein [Sphingobium yanoikuyae]QJR03490.1 hypothetical protein HH800_15675 [Sphingobium yanoikuyae]